jgi:dihydrofolate synthase / folylpolyglutamate synthase
MNCYASILEHICNLSRFRGMNCSLSTIEKLCEIYNHPQRAFATIHVAGTNGKGSVCTKIAASLHQEGYTTGLYTSPHIATFRERIQVENVMISEEEIVSLFHAVNAKIAEEGIVATFFELTTLLAFLYFRLKKVDIAVIETGLGGRWDATNILSPLLSVITSIGYDHTDILGTSLDEITREKAGIIKEGIPIVIGPDVPYPLIHQIAQEKKSPLYHNTLRENNYDRENQQTARLALSLLPPQFALSHSSIEIGMQAKPPCRFESYLFQKKVIFDVAHNSHGFARLLEMLSTLYPTHHYRFIVGFSKGKDISECAQLIESRAEAIHLVSSTHPRLASIQEIHPFFRGHKHTLHLEETIAQGIHHALTSTGPVPELLVIAGSFFIMHEARRALGIKEPEDPSICYDSLTVALQEPYFRPA